MGCSQSLIEVIGGLRQRVAELEKENARLKELKKFCCCQIEVELNYEHLKNDEEENAGKED